MEGKKKFTYQFDSAHERENFCLQVRQMKMLHSQEIDVDNLSVFIGTWNMGEKERENGGWRESGRERERTEKRLRLNKGGGGRGRREKMIEKRVSGERW